MPKKNSVYTVRIDDINNLGFGVGRIEGKVVFVSGAADGDTASVKIIKDTKDYSVARVEEILSPSPHRIPADCPSVGCGGCAYRTVSYEHELALKRRWVAKEFEKAGLSLPIGEVLHTEQQKHYRNKAQYPVAAGKEGLTVGFFAPKSHRVIEACDCALLPPLFGRIANTVRRHAETFGVAPYDEESKKGTLRHIYIRSSKDSEEVLLTLVVTRGDYPHKEELIGELTSLFPALVGVVLNENPKDTNVILGDVYHTLWGRPYLYDTLCDVKLKIAPAAFYQVNHDACELLYRKARELADLSGNEVLLDLYCGIGSIGLSMAKACRRLFGVEIVRDAIECARENAALNGIKNATFRVGDATNVGDFLREEGFPSPDVIVLDPPRKGADIHLLDTILSLSPKKLVYISCNPATLARDVAYLTKGGMTAGEVTPVDLFPRTGHVESVVCLTRSDKAT